AAELEEAGELAGLAFAFELALALLFECVSVLAGAAGVEFVVVTLVVLALFAGLLAVLLAACSPQAMPSAPSAKTDESTITFFIL
ncbi:hypothetical protein OFC15_31155, partial [Escherichia coli]|nr:hypothetical protein [Escherichia coli]